MRGGSEARQRLLAYGARRFKEGLTRAAHSPGAQSIEAGEVDATRRSLFCFAENKNLSTRGHAGTSEQGRVGCLASRRARRACGEASPAALSAIPAPPWTSPPRRDPHAAYQRRAYGAPRAASASAVAKTSARRAGGGPSAGAERRPARSRRQRRHGSRTTGRKVRVPP